MNVYIAHRSATGAGRPTRREDAADEWRQDAAGRARGLSQAQLAAVRTVMALFVEDDLARGVSPWETEYCPGCDDARPLPGFVLYDRASAYAFLCNACATEYEVARMQGSVSDIREFLCGKACVDTADKESAAQTPQASTEGYAARRA
jgi:hypothetical protein